MNLKQPISRHSILSPYRTVINKMQVDATRMSLIDIAAMISTCEREKSPEVLNILEMASNNDLLAADSRTLEWCLTEHAKIFSEWIEHFQRKIFKSQAKQWLPVILTGYVRLNRLLLLSKLMRGEPAYDFIFHNLMTALDVSIKHDLLAVAAEAPYGDGQETPLGTLIAATLLAYTKGPHANASDCYQLHQWLLPNATKTVVTEEIPSQTDATWMIDLTQRTIPSKYHAGVEHTNIWFVDASHIKELMQPLLTNTTFSSAYTRLFTPVFKKQSRAALSDFGAFDFGQLHTWLTEPHLSSPPKLTPSSLFSKHSSGCVFSFKKDEYDFRINQLWLIRPKKDEPLHIGVIRQIENEENSMFVHFEWIGKRPQPVELISEWSDVADSNRPPGWINGILLETIGDNSFLRILMPHVNTISGESVNCRTPGDDKTLRSLTYNRLLSIYPQHQLVEARRD